MRSSIERVSAIDSSSAKRGTGRTESGKGLHTDEQLWSTGGEGAGAETPVLTTCIGGGTARAVAGIGTPAHVGRDVGREAGPGRGGPPLHASAVRAEGVGGAGAGRL